MKKDILVKGNISIGDTVWWVHCLGKVYKGTVEEIDFCEGQGALYCVIHSPSFKVNTYPCVHYTEVFLTIDEARDFAEYQKRNPDNVFPICMKCHYNSALIPIMKNELLMVHAKWDCIRNATIEYPAGYECSNCKATTYGSYHSNFCHNCGAKMDLE